MWKDALGHCEKRNEAIRTHTSKLVFIIGAVGEYIIRRWCILAVICSPRVAAHVVEPIVSGCSSWDVALLMESIASRCSPWVAALVARSILMSLSSIIRGGWDRVTPCHHCDDMGWGEARSKW